MAWNKNGSKRSRSQCSLVGRALQEPRWEGVWLPQFDRNIFNPLPSLLMRSFEEVDYYRNLKNIYVSGIDVHKPTQNLEEVNFPESIYWTLRKHGFKEPTPIQAQAWPIALSGRHIVGVAVTGSGKTLAYLLPALVHIKYQRTFCHGKWPLAVVLAPTRELAIQIHEVAAEFGSCTKARSICIYGGRNIHSQISKLGKGVDIVIATPGRLLDLLDKGAICLYYCSYLVIDEADIMLDMGFTVQIRRILTQIRPDRQTLMFSATWPIDVDELASEILVNHIHVNVGSVNKNILQIVIVCKEQEKKEKLIHLLKEIRSELNNKTIVFLRTKKRVGAITEMLQQAGLNAECLHGGKKQKIREKALNAFRKGNLPILVTTDVASRGLDVKEIRYVIIYDFPRNSLIYIHRIGRTARGESRGTAFVLFTENDFHNAEDLVGVLRETNQRVPYDLLELTILARKQKYQ